MSNCVDFTTTKLTPTKPRYLPNPFTRKVDKAFTLTFSLSIKKMLQIRNNFEHPPRPGLYVPNMNVPLPNQTFVRIDISPICPNVLLDVSSFAGHFIIRAFDKNVVQIGPPTNASGKKQRFTITGKIARLEFEGLGEDFIHSICCYRE